MNVMRKINRIRYALAGLAIGAAVFAAAGFARADNFSVVSPTGGEVFEPGDAITIQWTETAPLGQAWTPPSVSIDLLRGGSAVQAIGSVSGGPGAAVTYLWGVPEGLSGSDFRIRVKKTATSETAESADFGINPERFTPLSFGPLDAESGQTSWRSGDSVTITWDPPEQAPGQGYEFHVTSANGLHSWLAATTADPESGSITFTVPDTITPGTYFIEVRNEGETPGSIAYCPSFTAQESCVRDTFMYPFLYRTGLTLTVSEDPGPYPDGTLIRESSSPEVWILKVLPNGRKFRRHVLTAQMADWYAHLGDFWSHVVVVADGALTPYEISSWIRLPVTSDANTWKIYEVNADMTKHWIECPSYDDCALAWFEHGGDEAGVYTVNGAELSAYANGPNVSVVSASGEDDEGVIEP